MLKVKNKVKNIKLKTININKNKVNDLKSVNKNAISNKKNEFHRSLEAFSDCV